MGHTNSTANIALPQFIGTDKPTWLGDVNGAFSAIDSKIGTIDADIAATDAKADNAVADASSAVTTATNANNTAGTASTTATNALNIANNALTVANNADGHTNQLEMKVGLLADLHTTDKTSIVNAINELADGSIQVSITAAEVAYNNTVSGLTATDVQAAIDELASGSGSGSVEITADGVKTYSQMLDSLFALVDFTKTSVKSAFSLGDSIFPISKIEANTVITAFTAVVGNTNATFQQYTIMASGSTLKSALNSGSSLTVTDLSTNIPTSGVKFKITY